VFIYHFFLENEEYERLVKDGMQSYLEVMFSLLFPYFIVSLSDNFFLFLLYTDDFQHEQRR
jgi:hypothetical protein